ADAGEHQDARPLQALFFSNGAADLPSAQSRHHDVEDDEIGLMFLGEGERLLSIMGFDDVGAESLGASSHQAEDLKVIVGDEDLQVIKIERCHIGVPIPGWSTLLRAVSIRSLRAEDEERITFEKAAVGVGEANLIKSASFADDEEAISFADDAAPLRSLVRTGTKHGLFRDEHSAIALAEPLEPRADADEHR